MSSTRREQKLRESVKRSKIKRILKNNRHLAHTLEIFTFRYEEFQQMKNGYLYAYVELCFKCLCHEHHNDNIWSDDMFRLWQLFGLNFAPRDGETPLMFAARNKYYNITTMLCDHRVPLLCNASSEHFTDLVYFIDYLESHVQIQCLHSDFLSRNQDHTDTWYLYEAMVLCRIRYQATSNKFLMRQILKFVDGLNFSLASPWNRIQVVTFPFPLIPLTAQVSNHRREMMHYDEILQKINTIELQLSTCIQSWVLVDIQCPQCVYILHNYLFDKFPKQLPTCEYWISVDHNDIMEEVD